MNNRIIKFKALRLDGGGWVEGDLVHILDGCEMHKINNQLSIEFGKTVYQSHKVHPETVCQFTGLTDLNGKEIWEGDIVQSHVYDSRLKDGKLIIKYGIGTRWGTAGFVAESIEKVKDEWTWEEPTKTIDSLNQKYASLYEVIGNIHDKGTVK